MIDIIVKIISMLWLIAISFLAWRSFEKINYSTKIPTEIANIIVTWACVVNSNNLSLTGSIQMTHTWSELSWSTWKVLNKSSTNTNLNLWIPPNAVFFASKRWKKLYNVWDTKSFLRLKRSNIIFFNNIQDANKAWYFKK